MTTVTTLPISVPTQRRGAAPTPGEIAAVARGIDDVLVDAAHEALDGDPIIASLQTDRDRLAACGDFTEAHAHHRRIEEMRLDRAHQPALDEEPEL